MNPVLRYKRTVRLSHVVGENLVITNNTKTSNFIHVNLDARIGALPAASAPPHDPTTHCDLAPPGHWQSGPAA